MARINEWLKGVGVFLVTSLIFYFFWTNIFKNIIDFITGEASIIGTFAWVSFVLMYLLVCPLFLVYTFISSSRNDVETDPLSLLKAIGIWAISLPVALIIYKIVDALVGALSGFSSSLMDSASQTMASQFSWLIGLICIVGMSLLPFYYILKGYGQLKEGEGGKDE